MSGKTNLQLCLYVPSKHLHGNLGIWGSGKILKFRRFEITFWAIFRITLTDEIELLVVISEKDKL